VYAPRLLKPRRSGGTHKVHEREEEEVDGIGKEEEEEGGKRFF
jgi:hypothetical protein